MTNEQASLRRIDQNKTTLADLEVEKRKKDILKGKDSPHQLDHPEHLTDASWRTLKEILEMTLNGPRPDGGWISGAISDLADAVVAVEGGDAEQMTEILKRTIDNDPKKLAELNDIIVTWEMEQQAIKRSESFEVLSRELTEESVEELRAFLEEPVLSKWIDRLEKTTQEMSHAEEPARDAWNFLVLDALQRRIKSLAKEVFTVAEDRSRLTSELSRLKKEWGERASDQQSKEDKTLYMENRKTIKQQADFAEKRQVDFEKGLFANTENFKEALARVMKSCGAKEDEVEALWGRFLDDLSREATSDVVRGMPKSVQQFLLKTKTRIGSVPRS